MPDISMPLAGAAIGMTLIGLVECFFGYRIFKVILAVVGFAMGGAIAYAAAHASGHAEAALIAGLIGGIVGAGLLVLLYFVGVFIIGASVGAVIVMGIAQSGQIDQQVQVVLAIGLGILGGILALVLQKLLIILGTSFGGAAWSVIGVQLLANQQTSGSLTRITSPEQLHSLVNSLLGSNPVAIAGVFVLGIAGVVVQYGWTGKKKPAPTPA